LDRYGDPVGRFQNSKFGSIATIRRKQLEYHMGPQSLQLAARWVTAKMDNQLQFCKDLAKNRPAMRDDILEKSETISANMEKLRQISGTLDDKRYSIEGLEGSASRIYFKILSMCMPTDYQFDGRSRQPAKDPFNSFLNYAYGILYSNVERACVIAGLDPFIGFLHTDNYNKKSLVFDIIENFRIHADRVVFKLFSKKLINRTMLDPVPGGYSLNKPGKRLLFDEFNKAMETQVRFGNKNMKQAFVIQAFCHQFANSLIAGDQPPCNAIPAE
ncbi:MAG: CRISPR-associated endonuclease Cas1, partial [bacterium]|nr:CRISPR-associated endonuclease Cas1 [bacterium]